MGECDPGGAGEGDPKGAGECEPWDAGKCDSRCDWCKYKFGLGAFFSLFVWLKISVMCCCCCCCLYS